MTTVSPSFEHTTGTNGEHFLFLHPSTISSSGQREGKAEADLGTVVRIGLVELSLWSSSCIIGPVDIY